MRIGRSTPQCGTHPERALNGCPVHERGSLTTCGCIPTRWPRPTSPMRRPGRTRPSNQPTQRQASTRHRRSRARRQAARSRPHLGPRRGARDQRSYSNITALSAHVPIGDPGLVARVRRHCGVGPSMTASDIKHHSDGAARRTTDQRGSGHRRRARPVPVRDPEGAVATYDTVASCTGAGPS